ncbi:MAG TPA: lipid-binding SYLF domain-containing protein [Steroidobacteraceae bacterium]|jgi:lipid-binding SYLF domain-containing protein
MNRFERALRASVLIGLLIIGLALPAGYAFADDYDYADTISAFKHAGASAEFFKSSYGYAVFPTIGKGGFVVGGALGKGRVYKHGHYVGDATLTQVSVGFQAGGQAYSEIIFFQTRLDLARFESGKFALGAQVSAVAITAGASASASTAGSSAGMSGAQKNAVTIGQYQDGIAVFTIAKGGLMYEAAVAGQKFSYDSRE